MPSGRNSCGRAIELCSPEPAGAEGTSMARTRTVRGRAFRSMAVAYPRTSSSEPGPGQDGAIELGGTHTNCAGGQTPWGTWITYEEIFNYGSTEANTTPAIPDAGRFLHEAVAWLDGALYETEDRTNAAFYRFVPDRRPREYGDLATVGGTLEALVVSGRPNLDMNTVSQGQSFRLEWVTIDEPNPDTDTVRAQAQAKGAAIFDRTEGIWSSDRRVVFDCTEGGEAGMGQVWELTPRGRDGTELKLIFDSPGAGVLEQ